MTYSLPSGIRREHVSFGPPTWVVAGTTISETWQSINPATSTLRVGPAQRISLSPPALFKRSIWERSSSVIAMNSLATHLPSSLIPLARHSSIRLIWAARGPTGRMPSH